jgi:hypothetical protein
MVDFFKIPGPAVTTPDLDAFRKTVQGGLPELRIRQDLAQRPAGPHQRHQVNHDALAATNRQRPGRRFVPDPVCCLHHPDHGAVRFQQALPWTDEAAVILYVWVILWSAAAMVPEREHVVFDLLWNSVGYRTRQVMRIVGNLLIGGWRWSACQPAGTMCVSWPAKAHPCSAFR